MADARPPGGTAPGYNESDGAWLREPAGLPFTVTEEEKKQALRWIETWRRAGPELERIRHEEIRRADTRKAMEIFDGLVTENLRRRPVRLTSGLIEQQAIFHRKKT